MNIALVLAGGIGARAGQSVPKQYLTVYETPIFIYTLKNIEESGVYDKIFMVCAVEWESFVLSYVKQYNLARFSGIIPAGSTRFESNDNGIRYLMRYCDAEGIDAKSVLVTIIDANRPLVPHRCMRQSIEAVADGTCDGSCATLPCYDSMYVRQKGQEILSGNADRDILLCGQSPETVSLKLCDTVMQTAKDQNLTNLPLAALMIQLGYRIVAVPGSSKSLKITVADDFDLFKALLAGQDYAYLRNLNHIHSAEK